MPTAPAARISTAARPGTVLDGASLGDAPCAAEAGRDYLYGDHGAAGSASGLSPVQPSRGSRRHHRNAFCWHITIFCGPRRRKTEKKIWKRARNGQKGKGSGRKCRSAIEEAQKRPGELRKEERKNMACSVGNASKIYFSLPKREKCTIYPLCFVTIQKGKDS